MKEIKDLKNKFLEKMNDFWYDTFYDYQDDVEKLIEDLLWEAYNLHR
jgi:hypothetical protein